MAKRKKLFKYDEDAPLVLVEPSKIEGCVCEDVLIEEMEGIKKLGEDMIEHCVEKGGLGLAAPQVGIMKNMFVWMNGQNSFQIVVNPKYFPDGKITNVVEGCLSYPGEQYYLKRAKKVNARFEIVDPKSDTPKFKKLFKKLQGERAFVFQHEADHLTGKTVNTKGIHMNWDKMEKEVDEALEGTIEDAN